MSYEAHGPCIPSANDSRPAAADKKHTVAFVMSDGDNLQWILGPWTTDERWWGASERGSVPLGWTLSPAIGHVASPALALVCAPQEPPVSARQRFPRRFGLGPLRPFQASVPLYRGRSGPVRLRGDS